MPISELELQMMQERLARNCGLENATKSHLHGQANACEQESELHQQIIDYCRANEFAVIHSRLDRATTTAAGIADFVVLLPAGRTVICECKRAKAKATPAQLAFIAHCKKLGHVAGVVWSFEEFLQIVNQAKL